MSKSFGKTSSLLFQSSAICTFLYCLLDFSLSLILNVAWCLPLTPPLYIALCRPDPVQLNSNWILGFQLAAHSNCN